MTKQTNILYEDLNYMNPDTGSVDTGANWTADCGNGKGFPIEDLNKLVQVMKNRDGFWVDQCDCDDGKCCLDCDDGSRDAEMAFHEREYRLYHGHDDQGKLIDVRTGEKI